MHVVPVLASASDTAAGAMLAILFLLLAAFVIAAIAGMWKMFEKAGQPGWAAIVPIYNTWVLAEIIGYPGWYGLFPLLAIIPFLGSLAVLVIQILFAVKLAQAFGKGGGMIALLIFLAPIGYMVLGFGDADYVGV